MLSFNRQRLLGFGALVVLTLIWAYNWIVMKSVLPYINAIDFSSLRTLLGFFILLFILKATGRSIKPTPFVITVLIGFFQTTTMIGFSQLALVVGGAGKVTIMVYTMPFWIAILSVFVLKDKLGALQIFALIVAALGLLLIIQPWSSDNPFLSYVFALASGLCWGIGAVITKWFYTRFAVDTLSLTTWQMGYGSVFLIIFSLASGQHNFVLDAPYLWFALFYNAALATALGWLLWMFILRTMNASVAGLCTLVIPVIAILLSWWLLNERPDNLEFVGIAFIVLGLIFINLRYSKKTAKTRN